MLFVSKLGVVIILAVKYGRTRDVNKLTCSKRVYLTNILSTFYFWKMRKNWIIEKSYDFLLHVTKSFDIFEILQ